ncbi:aminodeoxychorismate synthase component I [Erythrobacter litoralis]|uniref:Probable branched-chain-amino-acid aminotransferase n=1 Tax=Erythrobacter litoralis (strain HTCC2594) TaxID=314225 RepID=Q2N761_ERYLH|nr:aminodeoxychorismate synthase component I [Erythrobacter litoralis]ABC64480.1 Para-aminobenzoate synthase, component I [Erythrobacter litoralis HTCC2594]
MADRAPFVLLDDARTEGAAQAHLYEGPSEVFVAYRPAEVENALARAQAAQTERGGTLAGYIGYEAGLALEPKFMPRADARTGAGGPLVWLGLFATERAVEAEDVPGWLSENGTGQATLGPLDPQVSRGAYEEAFATLQEAIKAGDIYQANLTLPLAGGYTGDPVALYAMLRPAAKAGYGGLIFDGSHWLLSLSPELFVSLKDGQARAKPMKGTRPRAADAEADKTLAEDLTGSEKDKAENLMIVDLMRNDLSRVAEAGSVTVEKPFAVESYPTVHQMVTTVHARLQPGKGAMDLIHALFPCGSITGAPKIRAMELIDRVEPDARGPYCGAIGRIDGDGNAAFNVAIRTLRLTPIENERGKAVLGVGSAIVADSDCGTEWRETILKGGFARASDAQAQAPGFHLIETMRFDPERGIELLELHLERMKASAAELGFTFDRHATRNQIQALCFDLEQPARVRLTSGRTGNIALEATPLGAPWSEPARCAILPLPVDPGDWRLRHKTSDRGFYEAAQHVAREAQAQEALLLHPDGQLTEGCISNIFVEREGRLVTPPAALGLLPGVLRRSLIEQGRAVEGEVRIEDLEGGFFIGNAVRGLVKAELIA